MSASPIRVTVLLDHHEALGRNGKEGSVHRPVPGLRAISSGRKI